MPGPSEAATRKDLIDPALLKAGWDINDPHQIGLEIPLGQSDPAALASLQTALQSIQQHESIPVQSPPAGITDYTLKRSNGEILAVVEAKRTSTEPRLAQAQNAPGTIVLRL